MRRNLKATGGASGLAALVLFCAAGASVRAQEDRGSDLQLAAASSRFGLNLFQELAKSKAGNNTFLSPYSISLALAMTYNGAAGETQAAMAKTLEFAGMSRDQVNQAYTRLQSALASPDPAVQLSVSNSLWARQGETFRPEFLRRNERFYGAKVRALNFQDSRSRLWINGWVARQTRGKIREMVDRQELKNPFLVLLLLNAVYFKGQWGHPFDREKTREGVFSLLGGSQKKLPMMSQSGHYPFYRGGRFQAVSLPYGDGRMSLYVFLPNADSSLAEFQKELTAENWTKWLTQFRSTSGELLLPRFKVEYEQNLIPALAALGMGPAFGGAANFSEMISPAVTISKVTHKTFLEVNEEGTKAAASTSVGVPRGIARELQPFKMVVDRPFFCAIRDNRTGLLLFLGAVFNPA